MSFEANVSAVLQLRRDRLSSLGRRHPWVFSGAIQEVEGSPEPGDLVKLIGPKAEVLGFGHYAKGSIAVRMLSFGTGTPDRAWWRATLENALRLRARLGLVDDPETGAFRWIHGEGDGLPGLIIDVYGNTAVMHAHDFGMHRRRHDLAEIIGELLPDRIQAIHHRRKDPDADKKSDLGEYLLKRSAPNASVFEHGIALSVDWVHGQKTGLFLDQREHRAMVGSHARGRRVLNLFCYNGGFSLTALAGGAELVASVDASEPAMTSLEQNLSMMGAGRERHQSHTRDVFQFLESDASRGFDLWIVDPPAFAKTHKARHRGIQAYRKLNRMALERIEPGGLLFTFSCSQAVDRASFEGAVTAAAIDVGRGVRILGRLSQPADHPVSLFHPEGEYLKGLLLEVA
jgi:23S rRNA (cytosine1962-C5)-methyltransferase